MASGHWSGHGGIDCKSLLHSSCCSKDRSLPSQNWGIPPPPRIPEIIGLARNSPQNPQSERLTGQNLDNKELRAGTIRVDPTVTASAIITGFKLQGKVGCHKGVLWKTDWRASPTAAASEEFWVPGIRSMRRSTFFYPISSSMRRAVSREAEYSGIESGICWCPCRALPP